MNYVVDRRERARKREGWVERFRTIVAVVVPRRPDQICQLLIQSVVTVSMDIYMLDLHAVKLSRPSTASY